MKARMTTALRIGNKEFIRGTRTIGSLNAGSYFPNAPRDYLRKNIQIPFSVIVGEKEGPTICVSAGMDPTEYAAIGAAIKLSRDIKPENVNGVIIIIHVSNILGFWERRYISAVDGVQLPQNFPGRTTGRVTDVMAHTIFTECISKANFYIDLHGSDFPESMIPNSGYYLTDDDKVNRQSLEIAKASLSDYVLSFKPEGNKDGPVSSVAAASLQGIPSALLELGNGGVFSDLEITQYFGEIVNILKYLGIIDGNPTSNMNQRVLTSGYSPFIVNNSGLFYYLVKPGQILSQNDIVGEVRDLYGETLEIIRAPSKCVYLGGVITPVVEPGQVMGMLIPLE